MNTRENDLDRFIAQKGAGSLTTTPEGRELLREALETKMCRRKIRFAAKADALVRASQVLRAPECNVDALRVYCCPICDGWHLTKQTKQNAKNDLSFSSVSR